MDDAPIKDWAPDEKWALAFGQNCRTVQQSGSATSLEKLLSLKNAPELNFSFY